MPLRTLPQDLERKAQADLGERPDRRQEDIEYIKTWLQKQPHINANTDDQWILTFLRGCKFSLERTKEKLENYYSMRSLLPEIFTNRDPSLPELAYILDQGICVPLAAPDDQGRAVFLYRIGRWDPNRVNLTDILRVSYINMDVILRDEDRPLICGDVAILDFAGTSLAQAAQLQPSLLRRTIQAYEEAYPVRPKAINYINMSQAFGTVIALLKSFMKEKIKKRIIIHTDTESLHSQVPRRCLPEEYGGDAGPIDSLTSAWKSRVLSAREWLVADEKHRANESLRPTGRKIKWASASDQEIHGSFRALSVD